MYVVVLKLHSLPLQRSLSLPTLLTTSVNNPTRTLAHQLSLSFLLLHHLLLLERERIRQTQKQHARADYPEAFAAVGECVAGGVHGGAGDRGEFCAGLRGDDVF